QYGNQRKQLPPATAFDRASASARRCRQPTELLRWISSRQRIDLSRLLQVCRPFECGQQFGLMKRGPLDDETQSPSRQSTFEHTQCVDIDLCRVLAVHRVKVRRRMIAEKDANDDPVKSRDFRHETSAVSAPGRLRQTSCPSFADTTNPDTC